MYRDCFPFYAKSLVESERVFSYFGKESTKIRSSLKDDTWIFCVFYYHIFCQKFKIKKELKKAKIIVKKTKKKLLLD
jgi:hypothetical protein